MRKILGFLQSPGFRAGFLIVAIVAAIYAVASNWGEVSEALRALPAWLVAVEVLLSFGYVYLTMASWRLVLNDVGTPVNATVASRIFFSSQVAKYLPGGVWNFVAAAEVGRDYEISRRRSVCALLVSIVISIVTGMILAILAVVLGPDNVRENYGWLIAVLPLALIALCPPILNRLVNFALKVLGREPLEDVMTWRKTLRAALWALVAWCVAGLQLWLMLGQLGMPATVPTFLLATGGYALGWTAGFLVFFVPAGAGVREVALGAVLSTVAPAGVVVVVVLLARIFTTVADIGWGVAASLAMRRG